MRPTDAVLKSLKQYTGCGELIRKAISTPNRQNEEEAWNALCPSVSKLKDYYEFAKKIAEAFPQLLKKLCTGSVENNLKNYQTILKCFGDILHFVSLWDDLKVHRIFLVILFYPLTQERKNKIYKEKYIKIIK